MISDRELMEYLDGTTVLTDRAEDTAMTAIIMAIGDFPASIIRTPVGGVGQASRNIQEEHHDR